MPREIRIVKWYFVFVLPASNVSGFQLRGITLKFRCLRILGRRVQVSSGNGCLVPRRTGSLKYILWLTINNHWQRESEYAVI